MRQVDENYSPIQLEKDVKALWENSRIYDKVKKAAESGKRLDMQTARRIEKALKIRLIEKM